MFNKLALILITCSMIFIGCNEGEKKDTENSSNDVKKTVDKTTDSNGKGTIVVLRTTKGDITVQLDGERAPISVANFLRYVDAGFYNNKIFHRVIPNFMVQGGGFTKNMQQPEPFPPIKNEAKNGLKNDRGTIAMARTNVVNSATAQFYINTVDNVALNHSPRSYGYAVFGKVIKGMDIVDKISAVRTGISLGMKDVPVEPISIISAERKNK